MSSSSSSALSSSSSEDGNGNGNGHGARRGGGDFEGPSLTRRRGNNEIWPGPFVEDLVVKVAIDASRSIGRLAAAGAIAHVFQVFIVKYLFFITYVSSFVDFKETELIDLENSRLGFSFLISTI